LLLSHVTPAGFAAIMASTYKAYLGEGLGPLEWIKQFHIPHPGRVIGRAVLHLTMPSVLDWVLGGNNSHLARARPSACRVEDKLKVGCEAWSRACAVVSSPGAFVSNGHVARWSTHLHFLFVGVHVRGHANSPHAGTERMACAYGGSILNGTLAWQSLMPPAHMHIVPLPHVSSRLSCNVTAVLQVFNEQDFQTFMRNDDEILRSAHARWMLLSERDPSCKSADATSTIEAKGVYIESAPVSIGSAGAAAAAGNGNGNGTAAAGAPDLEVAGSDIAAEHARVWRDEVGDCWVQDLPSSSGTWVNGKRLHKGDKARLMPQVGVHRVQTVCLLHVLRGVLTRLQEGACCLTAAKATFLSVCMLAALQRC
jgi:hypothetical protein